MEYSDNGDDVKPAPEFGNHLLTSNLNDSGTDAAHRVKLSSIWHNEETFTPEEKEKGVPELKFAVFKRIPNVPEFKRSSDSKYQPVKDQM